jgi:hypothetical protein
MFVLFYNAGIFYCPFAVVRFANCMLERDPRHMLPLLGQDAGARVVWSCGLPCIIASLAEFSPDLPGRWFLISLNKRHIPSCAPTSAFGMLTFSQEKSGS